MADLIDIIVIRIFSMRHIIRILSGGFIGCLAVGSPQAGQTLNIGNSVSIVNGVTIINGKVASGSVPGHIQGSGKVIRDERALAAFTDIEVALSVDISISQGDQHRLTLHGDDNILPHVTSQVRHGTLRIAADTSFSTQSALRLEIVTPHLQSLVAEASGDISIQGIAQTALELRLGGSGRLQASGRVDALTVRLDGAGDMDLFALKAKSADVRLDGAGNIRVHADDEFSGVLAGSGDIIIDGNPRIKKADNYGAGDIVTR
jgi:hypothetical protein